MWLEHCTAGFKGAETKHIARMRGEGLRKLQLDREAREREARELARLVEADDDDDDEELERVWRLLEAWEKREILRVDASRCELTTESAASPDRPVVKHMAGTKEHLRAGLAELAAWPGLGIG